MIILVERSDTHTVIPASDGASRKADPQLDADLPFGVVDGEQ